MSIKRTLDVDRGEVEAVVLRRVSATRRSRSSRQRRLWQRTLLSERDSPRSWSTGVTAEASRSYIAKLGSVKAINT